MDKEQLQILMFGIIGLAALSSPDDPMTAVQAVMKDLNALQLAALLFMGLSEQQLLQCILTGQLIVQLAQGSLQLTPSKSENQKIGSMPPTYNAAPTPTPYGDAPRYAKLGAKLSRLNGHCPEGYEVEKYLAGGCVKCKKKKQLSLAEEMKCGGKKRIKKAESGEDLKVERLKNNRGERLNYYTKNDSTIRETISKDGRRDLTLSSKGKTNFDQKEVSNHLKRWLQSLKK